MPIRLSGLASGLDTEAIVGALVSAYSYKKDKYVKAQTKLSWKQDAWKSLNIKINNLYKSVGTMRYGSAYSMKKSTISDSTKATITASANAMNGTQSLKINSLAKAGYLTGGKLSEGATAKSKLVDLMYSGGSTTKGTISVSSGGKTSFIEVDANTTVEDFVGELNKAGVNANFDETHKRIFVTSNGTGRSNDFSIMGMDTRGFEALSSLGLLEEGAESSYIARTAYALPDADHYDATETRRAVMDAVDRIHEAYVTRANEPEKKTAYIKKLSANEDFIAEIEKLHTGMSEADWKAKTDDEIAADVDEFYEKIEADQEKYKDFVVLNDAGTIDTDATKEKLTETYKDVQENLKLRDESQAKIDAAKALISDISNSRLADDHTNAYLKRIYEFDSNLKEDDWIQLDPTVYANRIANAIDAGFQIQSGGIDIEGDSTAIRVAGEDAEIELNGAVFTGESNTFSINGLTIQCLATTAADSPLSITTSTDTSGLYDKVKEFLTSYNSLINEMTKLYGAESAGEYEPLTDDEKAEMSETEIEKWEQKIKDSLLRRDTTLGSLLTGMTTSMMSVVTVNGEKYSWSTFGIHTLGFLNADKNENYAYHIDGDPENTITSGNEDKLTAMLASNPDTVIEFMKQISTKLYDAINTKMGSTSVSSVYTVYNDKEMASEYSDYSTIIKTWTKRVSDMEDAYYKKFAAMEKALSQLQSNSSSVTSLFGQ